MTLFLGILGSSALTALITGLLVFRRTNSEADKLDAEAIKTTAEARKVEVDGRLTEIEVANKVREIYGGTINDLQTQMAVQRSQFETEIGHLKKARDDDREDHRRDLKTIIDQHAKCTQDLARVTASEEHLHIRLREVESMIGENSLANLSKKIDKMETQLAGVVVEQKSATEPFS